MNRPDILFPCLDSIRAYTTVSYETLVVAYMFSPENLEALRTQFPWVKVVPSTETRGFSENNNLALREAAGKYCLILNDDTFLTEPLIDSLVMDMESLPENAAAVSPCIRFPGGKVQTCGRGPWSPSRYAKHYLHLVDETLPSIWAMRDGLFRTYTLNGACFLVKTDIFREAGWFDERFFFTPEDIALGQLFNALGHTVWADAALSITHLAGGSVSRMEPAIQPARVRGALIYYGDGKWLRTFALGLFIWSFELLRAGKYLLVPRPAGSRNDVMFRTACHVLRTAFSKATPKELFIRFSRL
jgi:GT2 family glycosyltransferase